MDETIFKSIDALFRRFLENTGTWLSQHGFEIILILAVAWLIRSYGGALLARILEKTARSDLYPTKSDRAKRLKTLENLAGDILKIGVSIIAGMMIISELGVNTTPLLASAGALGIVLGIGAQSLVRDVASGFFVIINNQYRVGDEVEVRVGGAMSLIDGVVEDIGVRSTSLRDLSGNLHHVPNGNIMVATNKTIGFSRINQDFIFSSDSDIEKIRLLVNRAGKKLAHDPDFEKKIKEPPHFDRVLDITGDGIKVRILGKTGSTCLQEVEGEFYNRLIAELRINKIKLAKK